MRLCPGSTYFAFIIGGGIALEAMTDKVCVAWYTNLLLSMVR